MAYAFMKNRSNLATSDTDTSNRGPIAFLLFCLHIPLAVFFTYPPSFEQWSLQAGAQIAFAVTLVLFFNISFLYRERYWSVPSLTFLVLSLFHLGLLASIAVTGESPGLVRSGEINSSWFFSEVTSIAVTFVVLGLIAYSAGLTLAVTFWGQRANVLESRVDTERELQIRERFSRFGFWLLTFSIVAWFGISFLVAGPGFFLMTYMEFLNASKSAGLLNYTYLGISYGLMLVAFSIKRKRLMAGALVFAVFSIAALLLGMRDNVLTPAVCAVAIWASIHRFNRFLPFVFLLVGALAGISGIRVFRQFGLGGASDAAFDVTPLAAIEEMGFSLRVVFTTVTWHEIWDEPYSYGITYVSSIVRRFESLLGVVQPSGPDYRIMGTEISHRVGSIGGSMIAEAHHNFGVIGIITILFGLGLLIGFFTQMARTTTNIAILGVVMVLFLMHVRNSFTPIPFWLIIGLLCIWTPLRLHGLLFSNRQVSEN